LIPLISVTLTTPASATWPEALTAALLDAMWPLLMPIESVAPSPHSDEEEAIWTLHSPSKLAALACAVSGAATSKASANLILQNCPMTSPLCLEHVKGRMTGCREP
jgi:hypothetical protein